MHSIAQTPDGYLWFGTRDGLALRWSSLFYLRQEMTPGIGHNMFGAMLLDHLGRRDHAGRLWVGTLKGTALLTSAGRFETVPSLPRKSICFYEDRDGTLWAATDRTFARLTPSGSVFERQKGPNHAVEKLFEDRDGSLWVGTSGSLRGELEVLRLVAGGNRHKEIACKLGVTEDTVKFHVKSILGKHGVNDRTHALTVEVKRGILHID